MRILIRPRLPVLALLLFAPAIPELLTGSTPITTLFVNPFGFLVSFGFDIGLYGTGALLIREVAAIYRKGWASILLWGAAYGIAEEGFAVHTFFQPSGNPVGALAVYGQAFGVDWLWALGLTVFHATYSIALPILLTNLWFPDAKGQRWLDRGSLLLVGAVYFTVVAVFARLVGHGPSAAAFLFFLAVSAVLVGLGFQVRSDLLGARPGPTRLGPLGLALAGTVEFDAWVSVLFLSGIRSVPATVAAALVVGANALIALLLLRRVGADDLPRSEFYFATGMLAVLFVWDVPVEFMVPGILLVSAGFAYLQWRLGVRLGVWGRPRSPPANAGPPPLA